MVKCWWSSYFCQNDEPQFDYFFFFNYLILVIKHTEKISTTHSILNKNKNRCVFFCYHCERFCIMVGTKHARSRKKRNVVFNSNN